MKELFYDKSKSLVVAENWEEVSCSQFIALSKLIHQGIDDLAFACDKALYILSNKWLVKFHMIPLDIRLRMHKYVEWVFQSVKTTKQPLVKYRGLYGPADNFENLIMAEFHHTETAYHKVINDEDKMSALDELVAILFREPKPKKTYNRKRNVDGDVRVDFSFADIQYHQRKIKRWPLYIKEAIMLWYDACREELRLLYPTAFDSDTGSSSNYYEGLYNTIRSIAKGGTYGNFDKVEKMNVHPAFMEITESIEEAQELERKYKANQ